MTHYPNIPDVESSPLYFDQNEILKQFPFLTPAAPAAHGELAAPPGSPPQSEGESLCENQGAAPAQGQDGDCPSIVKGTRAEVAQALGISCSSLDRYFKMKPPLPHSKEGGLITVDTDKGKQWIEGHLKKVKTKRAKNPPKKQQGTR